MGGFDHMGRFIDQARAVSGHGLANAPIIK
jgi:hypothetical protein